MTRKQKNYERARRLLADWENNLRFAQAKLTFAQNKVAKYRAAVKRYEKDPAVHAS
jgi:hypothetical protein